MKDWKQATILLVTLVCSFTNHAQTNVPLNEFWKQVTYRNNNKLMPSGIRAWLYEISENTTGSYTEALEKLERLDKNKALQEKILQSAFISNYPNNEYLRIWLGNLCGSYKVGNAVSDYANRKYSVDEKIMAPLRAKAIAAEEKRKQDSIEYEKNKVAEKLQADEIEESRIYDKVQEMPSFNGNLSQFISENLIYPVEANNNNISGRVIIRCVVTKDGSVKDIVVVRGIGSGCEEEAKRVIALTSGKWNSGKQFGNPVNSYYTTTITFILN